MITTLFLLLLVALVELVIPDYFTRAPVALYVCPLRIIINWPLMIRLLMLVLFA